MMYETSPDSGEYQVSSDVTWAQEGYVFNSVLSKCENGGVLSWNDETKRVIMSSNTSDKCYVYYDKVPTLAEYIACLYTSDGENGLYYHDGDLTNGANDNSYRYSGANPDNYVCFGSDEDACPVDNLYRIIGVFGNQVKLIKYDYAGSNLLGTDGTYTSSTTSLGSYYKGSQSTLYFYRWNTENNNTWSSSKLNIINLNTNFINALGDNWSSKIAEVAWQVGGMTYSNGYGVNASETYSYEVGINTLNTIYNAKVGLMYVSDYYYGAVPTYWTYPGYSNNGEDYDYRAATDSNWLYMGLYEWSISRTSTGNEYTFYIFETGHVNSNGVNLGEYAIRPTFYLNSDVTYIGGTGTKIDPYRIQ